MKNLCENKNSCCVVIELEPGAALAYGRAVLLNEIDALHSVTKAAKTARMTKRHAKDLICQMNKEFSAPLVAFTDDNSNQEGVYLTEKGKEIRKQYWQRFEPLWDDILNERRRHF